MDGGPSGYAKRKPCLARDAAKARQKLQQRLLIAWTWNRLAEAV
jgi:hypothetical protein